MRSSSRCVSRHFRHPPQHTPSPFLLSTPTIRSSTSSSKAKFSSTTLPTTQSKSRNIFEANPFLAQLALCTAKTSACDLLAQVVLEKKKFSEVDWKRNGAFTLFGFLYLGGVQYFIYVNIFGKLFSRSIMTTFGSQTIRQKLTNVPGLRTLFAQIVVDCGIHQPFLYFPAFYTCQELMSLMVDSTAKDSATSTEADSLARHLSNSFGDVAKTENTITSVFSNAMKKYLPNAIEDNVTMTCFWGPVNLVAFSLPMHLRLPFIHCTALFWNVILSVARGGDE